MPQQKIVKAVILAAGFGTRMQPLSFDLPKPLMPLWGRPLLDRWLDQLADWGVRDVLVNTHHGAAALIEHLIRRRTDRLRVQISFEPEILGTGGALRRAAWFLDDRPFWLLNADTAAELDPRPLVRAFRREQPLAALWMHPELGPRTVEIRRGRVVNFQAANPGAAGTATFCGLHLLSPRILRHLPDAGFAGIIPAYERSLKHGEKILGISVPGARWADLGTPGSYLSAHAAFAPRSARREGWAAVGKNVAIARGAVLTNSVVWDRAQIGPRARLSNAIVGREVMINRPVSGVAVRADLALAPEERTALAELNWPLADTIAMPFGVRGSDRSYTRLQRGEKSLVLMRYGAAREENRLFAPLARFLAEIAFPVPVIRLDRPEDRLVLMEDVGDHTLAESVRSAAPERVVRLYRAVLDRVAVLHEEGMRRARRRRLELNPPFRPALYEWERRYFVEHFVAGWARRPPSEQRAVLRELSRVAGRLGEAPAVLLHRDLQSSNIHLRRERPVFLDFQGMRFGPAAYDLASLLCDPYVEWPAAVQDRLLEYARQQDAKAVEFFWWAAVERLAQALGAYGRLGRQPGLERFLSFIPPALRLMRRALNHVETLPVLRGLCEELSSRPSHH